MQALILAAGYGKRLRPLTDRIHKSLVEVHGTPLLINALNCLSGRNIDEVLLVVGDKKDMVIDRIGHQYKGMKITYIENPIYKETNNVYSFWLAKNYVHDDLIMLECDLFYRRSLIDKVLVGKGDANILVSPFDPATMDGTVVQVDEDGKVKSLIIGRDQYPGMNYGEMYKTVNIYTYRKDFICHHLMPAVDCYVATQTVNSYYELVLGALIYFKNSDVRAVLADADEWCEIDDMEDLKRAEEKFK